MLCPYPTICENDTFRRTGVHVCFLPECPYRLHAIRILETQIAQYKGIKKPTARQLVHLEKLKQQYAELLKGSG